MDTRRALLLSCTCSDYEKRQRPCKHLYLANRVFEPLRVNFYIDQHLPPNKVAMVHNNNNSNNTKDMDNIEPKRQQPQYGDAGLQRDSPNVARALPFW